MTMPSSARSSSSSRNSATESIPPETATPTRSPARSNSCRRMWLRTRSASSCTGTWYNLPRGGSKPLASARRKMNRRAGARRTAEGGCTHMIPDRRSFLGFLRGENALQPHTLLRDQLSNFLHEVCRRHVFSFLFPARAHVYFAGLRLFIAHNE